MAGQAGEGGTEGSKTRRAHRRFAQWTRDYARLPGIPDEYIAQDGTPRAVWTRFFDAFATFSPADIERRFGAADRHLREARGSYRAPGESADPLWPLSHPPPPIGQARLADLTAGIPPSAQFLGLRPRAPPRAGPRGAAGAVPPAAG